MSEELIAISGSCMRCGEQINIGTEYVDLAIRFVTEVVEDHKVRVDRASSQKQFHIECVPNRVWITGLHDTMDLMNGADDDE